MNNKRYLFRGFHTDEKGNTTITVDGKEIKGEWVFGYYLYSNKEKKHYIVSDKSDEFILPDMEYFQRMDEVLPETIRQWVTTDKNGKDVFEGDILKFIGGNKYVLDYDDFDYCFALVDIQDYNYVNFNCDELSYYELIGNKWECKK